MDQLLVPARPDPFGARATLTTANGATVAITVSPRSPTRG